MKFVIKSILKALIVPALILAQLYYVNAQTTTASILPPAKTTFFDQNGNPLTSGKVYFYIPGGTVPKTTWQDAAETIPNTNPVQLDAAGRAIIYGFGTYRQDVFDRNNNLQWSQVTSSPGSGSGGSTATGDGDLVGTVKPWAGMTAPNQYVFTYGQELNRALYPALYTAITSTQPVFCNTGSGTLNGLGDTTNFWIGMKVETSCTAGAGHISTVVSKTATTVTIADLSNVTTNSTATFFPWGNGNGSTTFNLPDLRGYVLAGNDIMGGTPAGVLITPNFGSQTPDASGAAGGAQTSSITITNPNLPPYTPAGSITSTSTANVPILTSSLVSAVGGGAAIALPNPGTTAGILTSLGGLVGTPQGGTSTPIVTGRIQPTKTTNFIIKITPDSNSATASGVTSLGLMTGDIACGTSLLCTGNIISVALAGNSVTNSQLANMPAYTTKCNNTNATTSPTDCTVPQFKAMQSISISVTDPAYGAKGDGSTDDTAAFQSAWNAACGTGFGKIHVPATANSYLVTKINGTNCNNVTVEGDGDQSVIKLNGFDADGNWWDLSGSNNIQFKNLRFIDNGSPVTIAFLWACTGTSCGTSGVLSGLSFDHTNANAKVGRAFLFGYGYGCAANCASNISSASLSITNSSWKNTYNQSVTGEETRNGVLSLSAYNAGSFRSVYVTLTTSTAIAARTHIYNSDFIDQATALSTFSNNTAVLTDGVNQMTILGGSIQCNCVVPFIGWTSDEGVTFVQTAFQNPVNGASCSTNPTYWMEFGGGVNSAINLQSPFWSCPGVGGAFIALDQGVGVTNGGINYLNISSNDPGLNTNAVPFIGKTAAGCGSFTAANNWIINSIIQGLAGANNITTCGSIDSSTVLQNPGTITIPGSSIDLSTHIGDKSNGSWTPADNSGAGLAFTSVSANWTRVGNMIFAYAQLTYPATADASTANISGLPITVPNVGYASQCSVSYANVSTLARIAPVVNTKTMKLYNSAGAALTNVALSGGIMNLICTYPAT